MGEEEKKMTTPFDEAMDWIATAIWYLKEHGKIVKEDIDWSCFEKDGELNMDTIKSSFIEWATIPDGWDIVKEIYQEILEGSRSCTSFEYLWDDLKCFVLEKLQQAESEVE